MYVIVSIKKDLHVQVSVIAYTDLSGKELNREVGICRVVISGILGGVMVNTQAQNARGVGSIPLWGQYFPQSSPPQQYHA